MKRHGKSYTQGLLSLFDLSLFPAVGLTSLTAGRLLVLMLALAACRGPAADTSGQSAQATGKPGVTTPAKDAEKDTVDDALLFNVEAATVGQGVAQAVYHNTAVLQADREAEISAKAGGVVESIQAEVGDQVHKGQVLAVLESDEQRLRLQQARANYEKTRNSWERAKKLLSKGLTNAESVSNLKYETRVLKSLLDQAQLAYDNTRIKSPIDGTLVKRFIKTGSLVKNGEKVFKVVDFDSLQAVVNVPEMQLQHMRPGLPARLRIDALDNAEIPARVLRVSPAIDESTGTFAVTLAIVEPAQTLRPGLFARVAIIYDQHPGATLVDKNAVIREDQAAYVWLIDGDRVKKQPIRTGYEMADSLEVLEGLQAGDRVVTTGKNNLSENARIHVIDYD